MRAATAAAEPPLDPPVLCASDQGLRVVPVNNGSVVGSDPNSGVLVLPKMRRPARFNRSVTSLSPVAGLVLKSRDPAEVGTPLKVAPISFNRKGTPV
jgi:hypothetical protein